MQANVVAELEAAVGVALGEPSEEPALAHVELRGAVVGPSEEDGARGLRTDEILRLGHPFDEPVRPRADDQVGVRPPRAGIRADVGLGEEEPIRRDAVGGQERRLESGAERAGRSLERLDDPDEEVRCEGADDRGPGLGGDRRVQGLEHLGEERVDAVWRGRGSALEGDARARAARRAPGRAGETFEHVRIDPGVIDPDDPDLLADLVLAALRDLTNQVQDLQRGSIGGLDLGDVNLGGLGGPGGAFGDL